MDEKALLEAIGQMMDDRIGQVNQRLDTMQDNIDALKKDVAHHNHYVEPLMKSIKEGLDGWQERSRQLDRLDDKVDDHDHRIWALEQAKKAQ